MGRMFFAKITERYLNYFLDRGASVAIDNLSTRENFSKQLAKHTFETAKITQSFAAGWFNKNAKDKMPEESNIKSFLTLAFSKMSEELRREAAKK